MLFGGLRERLPRLAAALISGLIFGGLHATTGISAVPPLIVFGFVLALLYEKTGSIVPGILLHMLNNSVALLGSVASAPVKSPSRALLALARAAPASPPPPPRRRAAAKGAATAGGPASATVKIEVGHLHGGKAQIYEHGAGDRHGHALRPRPAGRGHLLPRRPPAARAARSRSARARAAPAASAPAIIGPRGRQVRGQRPARRDRRRSAATAPCARAGGSASPRCTRASAATSSIGFKKAMRKMGYIANGGRCFGGKTGRERARLPQSQRHDPQPARRRGPGQERLRRQGRIPGPLPGRRRTRSRRRSPSRCWSSPRATSRSRSTRSPPASPRPRR